MEIYNKELQTPASKEFEKLLNAQQSKTKGLVEDSIIEGKVSKITDKYIWIYIPNIKSEPMLDVNEIRSLGMEDKIKVGAKIDVVLERLEDKEGNVVVSASKASKQKGWQKILEAWEKNEAITGRIISKCKGGVIVQHDDTKSLLFMPGSQISDSPMKNIDSLMNEPMKLAIIKVDKLRGAGPPTS